jgi:undecaprenyl-diphosphatase
MDVFQALLIGLIQGVLEWLPVSSQGQLTVLMIGLFGFTLTEALNYAVFLHLGTACAAIVFFRKDIIELLRYFPTYVKKPNFSSKKGALTSFLIVSTLITGFLGYLILILFESSFSASSGEVILAVVGLLLILTGVIQRSAKQKGSKSLESKDSFVLGLVQSLSALPGVSRSGTTVSGLLLLGHKSKDALRLSFLMSIPVVLGAQVGLGLIRGFVIDGNALIALLSSFVFGLGTLRTLMGVAEKVRFWKFCLFFGVLALLPLLFIVGA